MTLAIDDLVQKKITGNGIFDVLMVTLKAHLVEEHSSQRINGKEYATVYLGALSSTLEKSLQFLLEKERLALAEQELAAKILEINANIVLQQKQAQKVDAEILLTTKQIEKITQDIAIEAAQSTAQIDKINADIILTGKQVDVATAQIANMTLEGTLIPKQAAKIDAETLAIAANKLKTDAEVLILAVEKDNAIKQGLVLVAQECKLKAEFDLIVLEKDKTTSETALLTQKRITEIAQVSSSGVDPQSVIGKQATLYGRQADGFLRDAEQRATQLLVSTWNTRKTTDSSGTAANSVNKLDDSFVGAAVGKLLTGISA